MQSLSHFLKWIIQILGYKWDNIRFIELKEALKLAKYLKTSFSYYTLSGHFCRQSQTFERNDRKSKDKKGNVY